ncbi:hypothetical protein IT408_02010 [Candidatus Uhrbacteria bacterium]|nr:hypothetical protein [Candidatus Uhrbacteria bacterium]
MSFHALTFLLLRQAAYALGIFVIFCIGTETIFPGFAAPFVNIPLLGMSVIVLSWSIPFDAYRKKKSGFEKMISLMVSCISSITILMYLLTVMSPLGTIALIRFFAISLTLILCLFLVLKNHTSYE